MQVIQGGMVTTNAPVQQIFQRTEERTSETILHESYSMEDNTILLSVNLIPPFVQKAVNRP